MAFEGPLGASGMDVPMAPATDDERFALSLRHQLHPGGPGSPSVGSQVFECPDVMDLHVLL